MTAIALICVKTLPQFKADEPENTGENTTKLENAHKSVFFVLETVCMIWFTMDLLLRLVFTFLDVVLRKFVLSLFFCSFFSSFRDDFQNSTTIPSNVNISFRLKLIISADNLYLLQVLCLPQEERVL